MGAAITLQVVQNCAGVIGVLGNTLVCIVICRVQSMHTLTNGLILNQAAIDLLGSLVTLISANVGKLDPVPDGPTGELYCRLWFSKFLNWAFFAASTFSLTALTLERYLAILFPFTYQTRFTRRAAILVVIAVWLTGCACSAYNIAIKRFNGIGSCESVNVGGSQLVGVLLFCFEYLIPVTVMLYAYIHIIVVLKRKARRVGVMGGNGTGSSAERQAAGRGEGQAESLVRARKNVLKTLFIVFCSFVVCWTPNKIIFFMFNFGWPLDFQGALYVISVALVVSNSAVNPIIYALKYRQFRHGVLYMFGVRSNADEVVLGMSSTQG
ncbi:trace amine-associated receptor 9-like [Patiria miniata]|uniref:G-protein coupled receptors family 1 profile domain-containing protein n=1 Tax=Patiria miniata TaxID=46514 RepID=A0A914A3Q8_PATMI|nr:trace amine-associated receptor 9-like [Patiria miniata]